MKINQNNVNDSHLKPTVLFVDMNSFFPSCEQQVNYWLRHRPVGVCVYTGQHGSVIALSKEAKLMGIKPARLSELLPRYPSLVPLETNPARYREFHHKIMNVLRSFSDDVIPKSIDEAIVNLTDYQLLYKDMEQVAREIKQRIKREVGDWFTCSIGIAPNAFLAKLASDIQKPDGLIVISPETIDTVLADLKLTDLPGINKKMAMRLVMAGIHSPLQMRHTPPNVLRKACKSVLGEHWHYRLNFKEVDIATDNYKSMQAMRQVSKAQRANLDTIYDILRALCLQLEKRLMRHKLKAHFLGFSCGYEHGSYYEDSVRSTTPIQGAIDMYDIIIGRIRLHEKARAIEPILNQEITRMAVYVTAFEDAEFVQYALFGDNLEKDKLRKVVYSVKDKFGFEKVQLAAELTATPVMKDVIGFGSIKDIMDENYHYVTDKESRYIVDDDEALSLFE
jgi:DNA polymerase-4